MLSLRFRFPFNSTRKAHALYSFAMATPTFLHTIHLSPAFAHMSPSHWHNKLASARFLCSAPGLPEAMKSVNDRLHAIINGVKGANYRLFIRSQIKHLSEDPAVVALVKSKSIDEKLWVFHAFNFRRKLAKSPDNYFQGAQLLNFLTLVETILGNDDKQEEHFSADSKNSPEEDFRALLLSTMVQRAESELSDEIASSLTLQRCSDLRLPHEWYAPARLMKRKIIFHGGPTNSGKTYHALQRLMQASVEHGGGLYCGPLRLLALEVYEQLNKAGVYCNLVTGQEQRRMPFSTHTSCTVEVVPVNVPYDVAIIDEIQMIGDNNRGFAWTRALLGLCAREIHVAGGLEAAPAVRAMAEKTGDSFELRTYDRLSKLVIQDESLKGDYSRVRPGDCIVAFSKFDIFSIKREIENLTKYKCCVVYGKLPPETRSKQARLFNEPDTGFDILVASDAIGMGLNLNIRRIVFHTAVKPGYGKKNVAPQYIDASSIKQIAGRAGRLSSEYDYGEVTAWQEMDLAYVQSVMKYDVPPIATVGVFPSVEQIDLFSRELLKHQQQEERGSDGSSEEDDVVAPGGGADSGAESTAGTSLVEHTRLSLLLKKFVETSQTSGEYFLCEHSDMMRISNWLNSIPLTLTDRFVFATAPVSSRDQMSVHMLYHYAAMYATNRPVPLKIRFPKRKPTDLVQFTEFCDKHNILDLYLWLANRFPKYFIEKDNCLELKEYALKVIQSTLENSMLKHQYSHSQVFRGQRKRMVEDGSPTTELPHSLSAEIRAEMLDFLQKTPEEEWHMFPNESYSGEELFVRGTGGGDRSTPGNKTHSSQRRPPSTFAQRSRNNDSRQGGVGETKVKAARRYANKDGPPRGVRVVAEDKERVTRSADGRKVQKWNN